MFSATVPHNSCGVCGTYATRRRHWSRRIWRASTPLINSAPESGSRNRNSSCTNELLPAPDGPTIPMASPIATSNVTESSTVVPVTYPNDTSFIASCLIAGNASVPSCCGWDP